MPQAVIAPAPTRTPLARYTDTDGQRREVLARAGAGGSVLVVDQKSICGSDPRLVAHLAPDEPAENAELVCRRYLEHAPFGVVRCRPLTAEDRELVPFAPGTFDDCRSAHDRALLERRGFRLRALRTSMSIPELRWTGSPQTGRPLSLREVIARVESYEPARTLTRSALARHAADERISTSALRTELARVERSSIILNRGLRQAVLDAVQRRGFSMSEIAIRCGRIKHDRRGNPSGETSWLARRIGLLPDSGSVSPTPWIHSDVLALIARDGLGLSPREVELG